MRITGKTRASFVAALAVALASGAPPLSSRATPSAGQLRARIDQQSARAQSISVNLQGLSQLIGGLEGQIAVVQGRESAVRSQLSSDSSALAATAQSLRTQQALVAALTRTLERSRLVLARQLVSSYEADPPDLLTVLLSAHGFSDLIERVDFLRQANRAEQTVITTTRTDERAAQRAAAGLAALEAHDRIVTAGVAAQAAALAGMDGLLSNRRAALARARAIQVAALQRTHARRRALESALTTLERQQASYSSPSGQSGGPWAIPTPIVMCESGGQNLPPNGAGASGYYQIIASTWKGMGGSTPAAYLASKGEQDRIAAALWAGGRGASNWVCASLVH